MKCAGRIKTHKPNSRSSSSICETETGAVNVAEYEVDFCPSVQNQSGGSTKQVHFEERHPNWTDSTLVHGYIGLPVTMVRLLAEANC